MSPKVELVPEAKAKPDEGEPPARALDEIAFELDGQDRHLTVRDPGHATINRLSAPPSVAIIASAEGSSETLILKLGGVDLDRAALPLELHLGEQGVSATYIDPSGVRSSGRVDDGVGAEDHLTIDTWDPEQRRLRGRFAFTVIISGAARTLTRGSLDVVLHDPFDRRSTPPR
ncbi:hypothetical protein OEB96_37225 [Paraliomyxa miuraensis]|nr:hypothetical protein [Paraliomyxa miuraensis]